MPGFPATDVSVHQRVKDLILSGLSDIAVLRLLRKERPDAWTRIGYISNIRSKLTKLDDTAANSCRRVIVGKKVYDNLAAAAVAFGLKAHAAHYRVHSDNFPEWSYQGEDADLKPATIAPH